MKSREAFEAWARLLNLDLRKYIPDAGLPDLALSTYVNDVTEVYYLTWKEAIKFQKQQPARSPA